MWRVRLQVPQLLTAMLLVAILVTAVAAWVTLMLNGWQQEEQEAVQATMAVSNLWLTTLQSQLVQSISSSCSLAAFICGAASTLPNHTGSFAERTPTLNDKAFAMVAEDLLQKSPGLCSLQIQPSAIINQVYPEGSAIIGLDLYSSLLRGKDAADALRSAETEVVGPLRLMGRLSIIAWTPVFLSTPRDASTWWGMAASVIVLDGFFNATGIDTLGSLGFLFVVEFIDPNSSSVFPIANNTQYLDRSQATHLEIKLPNGLHLDFFLAPKTGMGVISAPQLLLLIGVAVVIVVAVGALFFGICWFRKRQQRDVSTAPKDPPFILLFTDIESSTCLWMTAPEAMASALRIHNAIIRRVIQRFQAYECKTIGDSFMIASSTVQGGLDVALEVQRALRSFPDWPTEISNFYNVPWMKVRIGAHYCTDVQCSFDEVSRGYDYFGNDANKAARVAAKALGGEILVSEELQAEAAKLQSYTISPFGTFKLRGIDEPQRLHRLHLTSEATMISPASLMRRLQAVGPVSPQQDMTEMVARAVVSEWLHLSSQECDEAQLLQFVLLCVEVVTIGLSPLLGSQKRDVMELLCDTWGIGVASSRRLHQLGLRIAQQLQPKYPTLFARNAASPQQTPDPSVGPSGPTSTRPSLDPSLDPCRRELTPVYRFASFRSSCVAQRTVREDDFDAVSPPHALNLSPAS